MASTIDPTLAKSLIMEYQTQNTSAGGPALKTPDGSFIKGFFIDRKILEDILNSDSTIAGVSVHLAKEPSAVGQPDNIFTILLAGAAENTSGGQPPYVRVGDFCGTPPPCPPWCTDLG